MSVTTEPTVIVGGGFLGLFAAMHLCHQHHPAPIILIDQAERFVFKPLLYELLSGELSEQQVWPKYDDLLNCDEITFIHDRVDQVDLQQQQLRLASGLQYTYGHLVLGVGSTMHDFGIPGVKDYGFPFRTGENARRLAQHLRQCLQRASQTTDATERQALLTVAIVGAGPAGVEMAATLGDLLPQWARKFEGIRSDLRVVVVNRSQDILKGDLNDGLRDTAKQALRERLVPVEIMAGAAATEISPTELTYTRAEQSHTLPTQTVIWTTGNRVNPLLSSLDVPPDSRDRGGRLRILPTLQLPDYPTVFAGGDCAVLDSPQPATAQVAYQQGEAIATNVNAQVQGQPLQPAQVTLRGTLMKLGLADGAANLFNRVVITGRQGHLLRQATYLQLLPNPVHNFKASLSWLTDELLQRHTVSSRPARQRSTPPVTRWVASTLLGLGVATGGLVLWRNASPDHFNTTWEGTGLPTLLNRGDRPHEQDD
ncbi:NAD(P)/FAD-dependent oxidoreductase [Nodosilinea sp. P-1105]|uniref:NAD(P)/FAD-dependent oxidoreductase n=1 Tax=Nodosilinea sp. P-1105 TaxID=2546229 RepID=UPI00146B9168|nr:NAD(P)/FAD-dependent oxidoreductase [Nodosilinea sp. P-1105]NMF84256.1 NAD(P)/FAD-dependent oxidoreductase [Nodosilinea sp. P-1105]